MAKQLYLSQRSSFGSVHLLYAPPLVLQQR